MGDVQVVYNSQRFIPRVLPALYPSDPRQGVVLVWRLTNPLLGLLKALYFTSKGSTRV